jgi:hypothetical protein
LPATGLTTPRRALVGALVNELGGFCPQLFGTEDYDLWLMILERGYHVQVSPDALAVYRIRPASVPGNLVRMTRSFQLTYERALERGALTPRQQRIAHRHRRLQQALEQVALIGVEWRAGGRALRLLVGGVPLFLRVAVENPDRWLPTMRILVGRGSPLLQVTK